MRALLLLLALLAVTLPAHAQDTQRQLRDSRLRLDSIRFERERLQREMESLQSRVRSASRDLASASRLRAASAAAVRELDLQAELLTGQVEETRLELETTERRLGSRSAALRHRLRSIYKRGPLHSARVLLGAESFGDLLNRYKYLHLITLHDRRVLGDVSRLQATLALQEEQLGQTLAQLENLRLEKNQELTQLRRAESRSRQTLTQVRQAETSTAAQLTELEKAEKGLNDVIARLERERRAAGGAAAPGVISTRDLGQLSWPVEGELVYRFGPVRRPSGVTLVNKGIGIAAPPGTPVRAVEAGTVSLARPFEGYGPTVMLDHGGGYYTLYMFLKSVSVREGERVAARQPVGTVGGEETPEGPHLYFQVRAPVRAGVPEAVDPLGWLRARASSQ